MLDQTDVYVKVTRGLIRTREPESCHCVYVKRCMSEGGLSEVGGTVDDVNDKQEFFSNKSLNTCPSLSAAQGSSEKQTN